jgi:hypothetical protein
MRQAPEGWDGLAQLAARESVRPGRGDAHHLRCAARLHHLTLAGALFRPEGKPDNPDRSDAAMAQSPIERATVRQARDDDRPTEDDIAKAKLGPQGVPGKPDKPPIADEDKLQLSKVLDPGHTA